MVGFGKIGPHSQSWRECGPVEGMEPLRWNRGEPLCYTDIRLCVSLTVLSHVRLLHCATGRHADAFSSTGTNPQTCVPLICSPCKSVEYRTSR